MHGGRLNSGSTFQQEDLPSFQSVMKSSPVLSIDKNKPSSWRNTSPGVREQSSVFI